MKDRAKPPAQLSGIARGFRRRTLKTATLVSRAGLSVAGRAFSKREKASDQVVADAKKLLADMNELKGLVMKFGQMVSYLEGALPPEAQAVLSALQSDSTPLDWLEGQQQIEVGLGAPVSDCFDYFETKPFAAASIGQVHRAKIGAQDVAVKVQYPGIREALRSDLDTFGALTRIALAIGPLDGKALAAELRDRMLEECDYALEAKNQRLFAELLSDVEGARVPDVLMSHSSDTVLTSVLDTGLPFHRAVECFSQATLDRAAAIIFEGCFRCLFRYAVFNGDPHPGNYLFHPNGDVTFLDFGCVRRFDEPFMEQWKAFIRIVMTGQRNKFPEAFRQLGWVSNEKNYDWNATWEAMIYLYRPFLAAEPFTYTHDYVAESYDQLIIKNPNRFKMTMPPEWLLLNRLQWGLNSVLSHLGATGDWGRIWMEVINGATIPR